MPGPAWRLALKVVHPKRVLGDWWSPAFSPRAGSRMRSPEPARTTLLEHARTTLLASGQAAGARLPSRLRNLRGDLPQWELVVWRGMVSVIDHYDPCPERPSGLPLFYGMAIAIKAICLGRGSCAPGVVRWRGEPRYETVVPRGFQSEGRGQGLERPRLRADRRRHPAGDRRGADPAAHVGRHGGRLARAGLGRDRPGPDRVRADRARASGAAQPRLDQARADPVQGGQPAWCWA